jgi:hypothetical protein
MPVGAALSEESSGEVTTHFGSIRIRVVGFGNLKMSVYSLVGTNSKTLAPLPMAFLSRYSLTRLVNFVEQRATFELKTINSGDYFRINRIIIFTKEIYKSYPGS